LYENYIGEEDYVFIECAACDEQCLVPLANSMAEHRIKTFFAVQGTKKTPDPKEIADAIEECESAVFYISEKACDSLEFRNSINYALEIKKHIIYICREDVKLTHGLDMQLANVPRIIISDGNAAYDELSDKLTELEVITQDVLGGNPKQARVDNWKKILLTVLIVAAVIAFTVLAWIIIKDRVEYYQSAGWNLRDADGQTYVSLEGMDEEGIVALQGTTIGELDLRGSNIKNLDGIEKINVKILILGNCEGIDDMDSITKSESLTTVKLQQSEIQYVTELLDSDIDFEIIN